MPASTPSTPTGIAARLVRTRWLMRAPIGLYRAHLGFLFPGRCHVR